MTRSVKIQIALAAVLLGLILSALLPTLARGEECPELSSDYTSQTSPAPTPCIEIGEPATATPTPRPTPEQDVGQPAHSGQSPWLICPPYTDFASTLPDGRVRCSVSSGETLIYDPQTDEWTNVFIPDTAMEAPR